MIVKNESHVIEQTLNSIYKYIDYYVINDTGSTDNTREIIKSFFDSKNIKGEIIDHEFRTCKCHMNKYKKYDWFHFGWNRTYALNQCIGKSDYILIMDADDIIVGDLPLPEKMTADSYEFKIGKYFVYYRSQLIKNDKKYNWKYVGGLHEYLDGSIVKKTEKLDGDYYLDSRRLGSRSKEENKYMKDAQIFEELLKDEPLNDRYMFYCAQSYFDSKNYESAIKFYEKRVKRKGFVEEVYYSLYRIGECKVLLKYSLKDIIQAFLRCHQYYPRRVEPLYEIIHLYRINNKFYEGYKFSQKALVIPYPKNDVLFVSKDIYDYKLYDEVALCAYYTEKYNEAYKLWDKVMKEKKYPMCEDSRMQSNLNFAKKQIGDQTPTKPILCFYVGYTPDYTSTDSGVYGSEYALKKISELLTEYYDVYIFGSFENKIVNKVTFKNFIYLNDFSKLNEIDVMIVSRYIHYFIEYRITARKTFIWLHDILLQPYWRGAELPEGGKYLLENVINQINGIVVLCDWHKQMVLKYLNIDENKIFIIGNGIDTTYFDHKVDRVKNRFIYMSNPNRGLLKLVSHFHTIKNKIPDAELYIYRGTEEFTDKKVIDDLNKYDYIKFKGKLPNKELIPEIMKSEYWYYPTDYYETYCISALEAQMSGCMCITSNIGALSNTIEDRGILLTKPVYTDDYWNEALNTIVYLNDNPEIKKNYIDKGKQWAQNQTWSNRCAEWLKIIDEY